MKTILTVVFLAFVTLASALDLPVAGGPFKPEWESLKQYQCPDWFRDAMFGIWAHWGPQCVPEQGDWYARKWNTLNGKSVAGSPLGRRHIFTLTGGEFTGKTN